MLRAMGDLAATDRRVTIKRTVAQTVDLLQAARDAAGRPAWRQAYEAYARVGREDLTPADLEQFAGAAWWNGKLDEAIDLRERAHAAYLSAGDGIGAARIALTLSHDHVGRGAFAVSHGWFAKAERLLSAEPESVEHARLTLTRGINGIFGGGDLREATAELDRAFELAARFGDRDTQALALVAKGRALVKMGEVEQGLALIDEATAAALGGELDPYSTGLVYCVTISSCQDLGDYRRAAEWTEQANRWCDRLDVTGFPGACRIHRAEIMRLRGDWGEAEQQALTACEELHDFERAITAGGSYKIGGRRAPAFDAAVQMESGRIQLAEGDNVGAARCLQRARDEWQRVGAPYEAAEARMLLGIAFRRQGDEHAATAELEAALSTFDRLGARLDEERVKELLGRLAARRTFLFTDIVDSTRLLDTLGEEKWKKLLARHDTVLRGQIVERGGAVIKQTGDGFFAAFDNPKAAVEAAVGIQRALADEIVAPDVRIGAHSGGAFYTDGDFSDYGGEGVHVAARIGAAAGAAEILFSRETVEGVPTAYRLSEPRAATLKGFAEPVELVAVDWR